MTYTPHTEIKASISASNSTGPPMTASDHAASVIHTACSRLRDVFRLGAAAGESAVVRGAACPLACAAVSAFASSGALASTAAPFSAASGASPGGVRGGTTVSASTRPSSLRSRLCVQCRCYKGRNASVQCRRKASRTRAQRHQHTQACRLAPAHMEEALAAGGAVEQHFCGCPQCCSSFCTVGAFHHAKGRALQHRQAYSFAKLF